jgi:DNA-binding transcriptional LysR family regulator
VLREATLAGVGVAQLPTVLIWEDIRAGRLFGDNGSLIVIRNSDTAR